MKKYFYVFLALICTTAIFSCKKALELTETAEKVQAEDAGNVVTIHAGFSEETKTSYAGEVTFSWTIGDKIGVWTTNDTDYEKVIFTAQATGPSVDFTGTLSEGYHLVANGKAFYPDGDANGANNFVSTFNGSNYTVSLGGTVDVDLSNPMAIIPLVGNNDGEGNYSFKTATGILKVSYENLQAITGYICVEKSGNEFALNGTFSLENDEVKMNNATSTYSLKYLKISGAAEGGSGVFYFPIPTGSIPAGVQFKTINTAYTVYLTSSPATTKAIPITRNKITNISVTLDGGAEWRSLGTGKFLDNNLFSRAGHPGEAVATEIQQNISTSTKFRLVNPYGAAQSAFGPTLFNNATRQDYLVFWILDSGESFPYGSGITATKDGLVYFEPCETGYEHENNSANFVRISHTNFHSSEYLEYSCVRSFQASGLPSVIQLAPKYVYGSSRIQLNERFNTNNQIIILFPGCNDSEILAGTYLVNGNSTLSFTIDKFNDPSYNIKITNYTNTNSTISWDGSFRGVYDALTGNIVFNDPWYFYYADNDNWKYITGITSTNDEENLELTFQENGTLKSVSPIIRIPSKVDGVPSNSQQFSGYPYLQLILP